MSKTWMVALTDGEGFVTEKAPVDDEGHARIELAGAHPGVYLRYFDLWRGDRSARGQLAVAEYHLAPGYYDLHLPAAAFAQARSAWGEHAARGGSSSS